MKSHREFEKRWISLDICPLFQSPESNALSGDRFRWKESESIAESFVGEIILSEHVGVRP